MDTDIDTEANEYCDTTIADHKKLAAGIGEILDKNPSFAHPDTKLFLQTQLQNSKLTIFYFTNLKRVDQLKTSKPYATLLHKTVEKILTVHDRLIELFDPSMVSDNSISVKQLQKSRKVYESQHAFLSGLLADNEEDRVKSMEALKVKLETEETGN